MSALTWNCSSGYFTVSDIVTLCYTHVVNRSTTDSSVVITTTRDLGKGIWPGPSKIEPFWSCLDQSRYAYLYKKKQQA